MKYLKGTEDIDDTGRKPVEGADSANKNADVKGKNESILTEYLYTNAGRIKEIITRGGISTSYTYDEDGNISRLTIGDGTEEGLL